MRTCLPALDHFKVLLAGGMGKELTLLEQLGVVAAVADKLRAREGDVCERDELVHARRVVDHHRLATGRVAARHHRLVLKARNGNDCSPG